MSYDEQPTDAPRLNSEDQQAIDRIFEHGLDHELGGPDRGEREANLINLLALLGSPVAEETHHKSRIDIAEVLARRSGQDFGSHELLTTADMEALDAFVDAGYETAGVDAEHAERAQRLERIGTMLTQGAEIRGGQREDLVISTLGAVQSHIDSEEAAMQLESKGGFQLPSRWADLVSIAAMLLLAASVIMPIMSGLRSSSQRQVCYGNMNETANAFGLYTGANRDMLPMATAGFGPTWMDVGSTPERSNSSNLFTLIRKGFADLDDLACPTNPNAVTGEPDPGAWDWSSLEELSYSYRIMPRGGLRATEIERPVRVVLLADRSPVIIRAAAGKPVIPEQNTPNHNSSGQHMLLLDGSARWTSTPVLDSRDNIWLPRPIETLIHDARTRRGIVIHGNEQPGGPTDAFVAP